ncbi:NB-ARC domain-containing protein [Streptomyces sp. NRRL WC-3742]|uniref:NB-ARC domain-containing protein n=1 Tax=Streptomyces sp. NRRL WC-3742 TaxID=1463934 RepID=UPI00068BB40D|nr:NB-ARC domain-containing protein [Streptomyces sp. NRRL WC-3742]
MEQPLPQHVVNSLPGNVHGQIAQVGSVHGGITFNYHASQSPDQVSRRPDQVPRPPHRFVNREWALAELDGVLADAEDVRGCPIGVFSGLPGIGKSAAARQWAHRHQERFPGGQFYVDFGALSGGAGGDVSEALAMCLRGLGVYDPYLPARLADRAALYRTLSADRRMLVVLDDVSQPAQVTALLPQGVGSAVLATSTWRLGELALDGATLLHLDVLDRDSSLELLAALCEQRRVDAEPDAAGELVGLCGGLPMALRLCAARLMTHRRLTIGALVDELADEQSRFARIAASAGREERTMAAALELVYRDLPDTAAKVYRILGCLPNQAFDTALTALVSGHSREAAQEALDTLEAASLLTGSEDGRYTVHGLVRLHARDMSRRLDPPGTEREVVRLASGHYRALALLADLAVRADRLRITEPTEVLGSGARDPESSGNGPFESSGNSRQDALDWLEAERGDILAVLRAAATFGFDRHTWQLTEAFTVLFLHHRHVADWRESLELGAAAANRDGQPAAEARLRSLLSRPLLDLGRDDEAREHLETADRLAVESGRIDLQASVQEFLGRYWDRHDPARAADAYRASLALNLQAGEGRGAALARYFLGCAQSVGGDHVAALAGLAEARAGLLARGDARMAARVLADLGRTKARRGDRAGAVTDLRQAVTDLRAEGASHYEARALEDLADLLDDPAETRDCLRRALAVYEEGGSPHAAEVLSRLTSG